MESSLSFSLEKNHLLLTLTGDFIGYDDLKTTQKLNHFLHKKTLKKISFNTSLLQKWDSSLVVILYDIFLYAQKNKITINITTLPKDLQKLLSLALSVDRKPPITQNKESDFFTLVGQNVLILIQSIRIGVSFLTDILKSIGRLIAGTAIMRKIDFWFALDNCGPKAIGIVSLISFMVGLILAFVGALQLKLFGAEIYVASLVSIGMTRIMGAIMCGIIMAGRTGASYAAEIGTMQVNEELDALKTMGIPHIDFLVLPRILALVLIMPLLTMWSDIMGILGGAAVGVFMLDIAPQEYWSYTIKAFTLKNFLVGTFHGFVFGAIIAICGCYYGIKTGRTANSVGLSTTKAVVSAIVWMIVITGIITWILGVLGI